MSRAFKTTLVFSLGFVVGGMFIYGFLWYQVFHKIDNVFYCQVFTGKLSVDQAAHCKKYESNNERKNQ